MYVVLFSILFRDFFFFFNDTATTEIYTLSLHDALPISGARPDGRGGVREGPHLARAGARDPARPDGTRVSQRPAAARGGEERAAPRAAAGGGRGGCGYGAGDHRGVFAGDYGLTT